MHAELQISFRHMPPSLTLEQRIRRHAARLERFCDDILRCQVVVEAPHRHRHKGRLYTVKIALSVPGEDVTVQCDSGDKHAHEDAYVTVRDAFKAARRRLEDHVRRRRGQVKRHEAPPTGRVSELYPYLDYGRIATPDGREIYFHRNSLLDADFDALEIGTAVRFAEEAGDLGPQATSVHVLGRHHPA